MDKLLRTKLMMMFNSIILKKLIMLPKVLVKEDVDIKESLFEQEIKAFLEEN